ncbi:uncharacterized protein F4812DRAFT_183336 [Daldinia caldariorum]|uniref:uncharacterized protein n=1 Tax=Daldinia caldariorum TaxID=326644 RepID=UPI002008A210|nr:uncharacterized protein F4812DRAFT_183336 [Daldinia caldariorum]KAI1471547.1 hypothetical protein F4812DRAFT_183336 [Daldinia caldariorum]
MCLPSWGFIIFPQLSPRLPIAFLYGVLVIPRVACKDKPGRRCYCAFYRPTASPLSSSSTPTFLPRCFFFSPDAFSPVRYAKLHTGAIRTVLLAVCALHGSPATQAVGERLREEIPRKMNLPQAQPALEPPASKVGVKLVLQLSTK